MRPPPIPAASNSKKAPTTGDPSKVEMAAKLPAAPMITMACLGASFLIRRTIDAARTMPITTSGISGPSTPPKLSVASEATRTLGRSFAVKSPPIAKPSAGLWPPVPGR